MTTEERDAKLEAMRHKKNEVRLQAGENLLRRVKAEAFKDSFHLTREPQARERGLRLMEEIDRFLGETPSGEPLSVPKD